MVKDDVQKLLKRLDRPPSAINFVKLLGATPEETAQLIVKFVLSKIRWTYQTGYTAIRDHIELQVTPDNLKKMVTEKGAPLGRQRNLTLLDAFLDHDAKRQYAKGSSIGFDRSFYQIGQNLRVPVSPLTVIREEGKFLALFVCGWSRPNLGNLQHRCLWTMIEDAFLSLSDFENESAEMCFFPYQTLRMGEAVIEKRQPTVVRRGEFALFSKAQMDDLARIYLEGREIARRILLARIETVEVPEFMEDPDQSELL